MPGERAPLSVLTTVTSSSCSLPAAGSGERGGLEGAQPCNKRITVQTVGPQARQLGDLRARRNLLKIICATPPGPDHT